MVKDLLEILDQLIVVGIIRVDFIQPFQLFNVTLNLDALFNQPARGNIGPGTGLSTTPLLNEG
jgi:hypothetical protein